MEKSNEKKPWWKKVLITIGSVFAGLIALLVGGCLSNRRRNSSNKNKRAEHIRADIDTAKAANTDSEKRVEQLKDTVGSVEQLNNNIEQSADECLDIIRNVRERNKKG